MKTLSPATQKSSSSSNAAATRSTNPFFQRKTAAPFFSNGIQAKLSVSEPGDPHEREADQVADHVMRSLNEPFFNSKGPAAGSATSPPVISRVPASSESAAENVEQLAKEDGEELAEPIQRMANPWFSDGGAEDDASGEPTTVSRKPFASRFVSHPARGGSLAQGTTPSMALHRSIGGYSRTMGNCSSILRQPVRSRPDHARGPPVGEDQFTRLLSQSKGRGQPLPKESKTEMESAFGADFSQVRVHTGDQAAQLANRAEAVAFAAQGDIYFNRGQFQPQTPGGKQLLAHELTHVVQQGKAVRRQTISRQPISRFPAISSRGPPQIQRGIIPDSIRNRVNSLAEAIPGFTLMTVLVGYNPILDANVDWSARNFFRGAAGLIPFGTQIFDKLESEGIIDSVFSWVGAQIDQYNLTLSRVMSLFDQAYERMDFVRLDPIDFNVGIVRSTFSGLLSDVASFAGACIAKLIEVFKELAIKAVRALFGENSAAYDLITQIIGEDPLTGEAKEWDTANFLRAVLRLFGFEKHLQKMEEHGQVEKAAAWIDEQVSLLVSAFTGLISGVTDLWTSLNLEKLVRPDQLLTDTLNVVLGFVTKLAQFATNVAIKVLELIKEVLILLAKTYLHGKPGYKLFTVVLGQDPVTQEEVPRTATNFVKGFLEFVPKGLEIYQNLVEGNAIGKAMDWLEEQANELGLTPSAIVERIKSLWNSFSIDDIFDPLPAFERVAGAVLGFIGDVLTLAGRIAFKLLEILFEVVMGGAGAQVLALLKKGQDTFKTIVKDPVGFIGNLISALKQGFEQFGGNIWEHLKAGLFGWLFGALEGAGLQLPAQWDLKGIMDLALQVLGLTYRQIRPKLVDQLGERAVAHMETAFEFVRLIVTEGIGAAWEKILEFFTGNLVDIVIDGIKDWVVTKIVTAAITKLATMFNPAGAVIQAILTIYNTVMFFIERMNQIMALAESVINSVSKIASGAIGDAANFVEQSMARALPVIISFLARLIGLGGISEKIRGIIMKVQAPVSRALDRVIGWIVAQGRRLFRSVVQAGTGDMSPQEKLDRGMELAVRAVNRFRGRRVGDRILRPLLSGIAARYSFTSLDVVARGSHWVVVGRVNPGKESPTDAQVGGADPEELKAEATAEIVSQAQQGISEQQIPAVVQAAENKVKPKGAQSVRAGARNSLGSVPVTLTVEESYPLGDLRATHRPAATAAGREAGRGERSVLTAARLTLSANAPIQNIHDVIPETLPAAGGARGGALQAGGVSQETTSGIDIFTWNTSPRDSMSRATQHTHAEEQLYEAVAGGGEMSEEKRQVIKHIEAIAIRNFNDSTCDACAGIVAQLLTTIRSAQGAERVLRSADIYWTRLHQGTSVSAIRMLRNAGWTIHVPSRAVLPEFLAELEGLVQTDADTPRGRGRMIPGALPTPEEEAAQRDAARTTRRRTRGEGSQKSKSEESNDPLEVEADKIADMVTESPAVSAPIQRAAKAPGVTSRGSFSSGGFSRALSRSSGGGEALPSSTRSRMEPAYGSSFGDVRVHTSDRSAKLCDQVNARAFTRGSNIYFNSGEYNPGTRPGQRLLAHELTHVVQQRGSRSTPAIQCADQSATTTPPPASTAAPQNVFVVPSGRYKGTELDITAPSAKKLVIKTARLSLPTFKQRNRSVYDSHRSSAGGKLSLRQGERGETKQVENWLADVQGNIQNRLEPLKQKARKAPSISPSGNVYYFKLSRGQPHSIVFGSEETLTQTMALPFWDRRGELAKFQVDHIVEDQVQGQDVPSNYELLEASANASAGSSLSHEIYGHLAGARDALIAAFPELIAPPIPKIASPKRIRTHYDVCFLEPPKYNLKTTGKGGQYWSRQDFATGQPLRLLRPLTAKELAPLKDDTINAVFLGEFGGVKKVLPPKDKLPFPLLGREVTRIKLVDYDFAAGTMNVEAFKKSGEGLIYNDQPLQTWNLNSIEGLSAKALNKGSVLSGIRNSLRLPGLSPIRIDSLEVVEGRGLVGSGKVLPTIPIVKDADIDIVIDGDDVRLQKTFDVSEINLPKPLRLDAASFSIFYSSKRGLGVSGEALFGIEHVGTGMIRGAASKEGGFELEGSFDFDPDLFTRARVGVSYKNEKWSFDGAIGIDKGKIPGIDSADIAVSYKDEIFSARGDAILDIPGVEKGALDLKIGPDQFSLAGEFHLTSDIPGIKSGKIGAAVSRLPRAEKYSVQAAGEAFLDIPGIDSAVSVTYDDGAITIWGRVGYTRDRLSGVVEAGATNRALDSNGQPTGAPTNKFSFYGKGQLVFKVTDWLKGTVGVEFLPNREMIVGGELALDEAIEVFERKATPKKDLFTIRIDIPIFGVPVGPKTIGLKAFIKGGLYAEAGVGPGTLEGLHLGLRNYNPERPETAEVYGGGRFVVKANATLSLEVDAGIGLDVLIGGVEGSLGVSAGAELNARAQAEANILWKPGQGFELKGDLSAELSPRFFFAILGKITAWFAWWDKTWTWKLKEFEYGPEFKLGFKMPMKYVEGQEFSPSLDDIKFTYPNLKNDEGFFKGLFKSARGASSGGNLNSAISEGFIRSFEQTMARDPIRGRQVIEDIARQDSEMGKAARKYLRALDRTHGIPGSRLN